MHEIQCPHRSLCGDQPVCQIVSQTMNRPLNECHVNDPVCEECLKCGVPPEKPNVAIVVMSVKLARRLNDPQLVRDTMYRFKHVVPMPPIPETKCVLRGRETRKISCKPCQADSPTPVMIPVFTCPRHTECTLHNTGTFPKIQACATCGDRLEKYYELDAKPIPAAVLAAIPRRGPSIF